MGYTTDRRASVHFTAEATLGVRVGIARRVSYSERISKSSNRSNNSSTTKPSAYPCHHKVIVPEPYRLAYSSLHTYCIAIDATYARLATRLDRMRCNKDDVASYVGGHRDKRGLRQVLKSLNDDVGKLERILQGMRERISEDEGDWDGSGKAFLVGGRWATFL